MTQPAIHFGVLSMAASHRSHLLQEQIGGETSVPEIRRSLKYRNEVLRITQESLMEAAPPLSKITSIVIMIAYLLCIEVQCMPSLKHPMNCSDPLKGC